VSGGYLPPSDYYTKPILWGSNVSPRNLAISQTTSQQLNQSVWYATQSANLSVANSSGQYVSTPSTNFVTVSTSGLVTAIGAVNATGFIKLRASNDPVNYTAFTPFRLNGDSIAVNITDPPPPPPPPPFKIDSIWADQVPITIAQWTTVHARVVNPPGTPYAIRWIVTDSRTPSTSDTLFNYGDQMDINIGAGSYTITFRARPQYGSTIGIEFTQSLPVCTGSSNLMSRSELKGGKKGGGGVGGPTPNAVGGC